MRYWKDPEIRLIERIPLCIWKRRKWKIKQDRTGKKRKYGSKD
jgi:hypothetical protein